MAWLVIFIFKNDNETEQLLNKSKLNLMILGVIKNTRCGSPKNAEIVKDAFL